MDETLLHAATLEDIYENQVYGSKAMPSFITKFEDNNCIIKIGVFLRPYLKDMLERIHPHFDICVFTASEKLYANAILD
jgi:TFIIF-interacting CTD phosphatase-like protein